MPLVKFVIRSLVDLPCIFWSCSLVKGVNYFGQCSEYIVSGSDCGHVFLWDKHSQEIVQYFEGDREGVVSDRERVMLSLGV